MARARLIKPGFFTNGDLCALPPHARILFAGLWTLADREGRLKDEPIAIKGALFPYEDVDIDDLLSKLVKSRFIVRYGARTNKFLAVVNFKKHQNPHVREAPSQIPPPTKQHRASTVLARDKHSASPAFSGTSPAVTDPVPIADPVSGTARQPPDIEEGDGGFYRQWFKHYEQGHAAPPSPNDKAAARKLERDFGTKACSEVAADYDWTKHPNWLRRKLEDPEHDNRRRPANGVHSSEPDSPDEAPDHPYGDIRPKFVSPRRRLLDAGGASDG